MCAIASLEIVMRPSGDQSACPASTTYLTTEGRSELRHEQLGPLVRADHLRVGETRLARQPRELLVRVEMAACRKRVRRGRRAFRFRGRREDHEATALRIEHTPHLAERPHRIWEEEERDE